ncbi:MAG: 23S rRNA (uracil(1939)-C(5))-methyltransferase RlmD [Steroidobacteraceae bacterium]
MTSRSRRVSGDPEVATVTALTHDGEGIVRSGKAAFVAGALPGESIRFRRTRQHRQHDEAQLIEVLEAAPARVAPRCAHFGICGGCALQHLAPEAQLEGKQAQLRDNFARLGHLVPHEWLPPLRGPVWSYRRRARLGSKFVVKKDRVVVGFRERLAPYVAQIKRCEVLAPPVGALIEPLAVLLTGLSIRQRLPQIEVAVADNAVALVLRVLDAPSPQDLACLREFAATHGVRFYLQPGGLDSVEPLDCGADAPAEPLHYGLPGFGLRLEFTPTDFVQVNGPVNEALVARAVELLGVTPSSVVLDLYCGIGNFTLALAKRAGRVVGVEGDSALVERARHNARLNGILNAEFHMADLGGAIEPGAPWLRHAYTHVLLDPPRAGASAMLATVARLQPQRVLYISCHPGSLARDAGVLVHEHGMSLRAAGVVDMFPHTAHIESLALLEPGEGRGRAS